MRLWTISEDKQEFDRMKSLVDGSLKHSLTSESLNGALPRHSRSLLEGSLHVACLHDGSDIRKEHSRSLENLGKVRSASGRIINGYQTFNTVLVDCESKDLRLFRSTPYSSGATDYESAGAVRRRNKERMALPQEDAIALETASESGIIREHLRLSSEFAHEANEQVVLTHILDRKHDETALFEYIDGELGDKFVIRVKSSRLAGVGKRVESTGKEVSVKLASMPYKNQVIGYYPKLRVGKRVYQDARLVLDYDLVRYGGREYGVVRAEYRDRHQKPILKSPMLLVTNHRLDSDACAKFIFALYGLRARIEEVFHFLKVTLGWEDIQVRDWASQKALLSLCFFIGGYFYEIESALTSNQNILHICELGGSKGICTREFFLRGLAKLMNAQSVQSYFLRNNISQEQMQTIFDWVRIT